MKKLTILIVLLVSFSFVSKAQMNFGVKAGFNMASVSGDMEDTKFKPAYQIGAVAKMELTDAIDFQPGIVFSSKGVKQESSMEMMGVEADFTQTTSLNYLELPLDFIYNISEFQIIAGPYVGYGLGGNSETEISAGGETQTEDADVEFVSDATDADEGNFPVKNLDYGLNVGAGYNMGGIQIQAIYGLGIANLNPPFDGEDPENSNSNSVIQLNVSYFF